MTERAGVIKNLKYTSFAYTNLYSSYGFPSLKLNDCFILRLSSTVFDIRENPECTNLEARFVWFVHFRIL